MNKDLIWNSSVEFDKDQVKRKIKQLENDLGVKFPQKYIDIVTTYDKARPFILDENGDENYTGIIVNKENGLQESIRILSLKEDIYFGKKSTGLDVCYDTVQSCLPEGIYPFAANGGEDLYLFDYRKNTNNPFICYLYHYDAIDCDDYEEEDLEGKTLEEAQNATIHKIYNSFDEFLDNITLMKR